MPKPLTVGRLAELSGLSRKSIRYYEQERLIPKADRSPSGYRLYDPAVLERLRFIQKAKAIGFSLDDVRRILELTDKGRPCCDQVFEWSEKRLHDLDEQIRFLNELRKRIVHYQRRWKQQTRAPAVPEAEMCRLIAEVEIPAKENGS